MSPLSVNITVLTNSWKNPILYMRVSCMCVHECAPIVCVRAILTHLHTCVPGICSCTCFGFWGAASRILRGDRWGGCCLSCFVQLSTESGQMILKGQSFAHTHSQSPYSHTDTQTTNWYRYIHKLWRKWSISWRPHFLWFVFSTWIQAWIYSSIQSVYSDSKYI